MPTGFITVWLTSSLNSTATTSVPTAPRKSITYCALKEIDIAGPPYSTAICSRASPRSGVWDAISTRPGSIENLTARDRSFDSSATRRMALWNRSRSNSTRLSLFFGMTRSYAGNWASIIRDTSSRPSIRKKMWLSSRAKRISSSPSASRRLSSDSVFFGRIVRVSSTFGSPARSAFTIARRWPSVATSVIASCATTKSAPFRK